MDFKIKFKEAVFVRDESLDFQEKTVEPSRLVQEVVADTGFDGLKKVTVKEIPSNLQDVSATTAQKDTVLQGKKFISSDGLLVEGSMPNNGAVLETIDTKKTSYTIPKGYHNGEGTVSLFVESKTIVPTKTTQIVKPSNGKVLSEVNIEPIPEEYIIPKGSVSIVENGSYNVEDYKDAVVSIPNPTVSFDGGTKELYGAYDGATITITQNGEMDIGEMLNKKQLPLKINIVVVKPNEPSEPDVPSDPEPVMKAAGLYQTGTDTMTKSWEDLLSEGVVHVDNGVVYTNFDYDEWVNSSSEALTGDLVLPDDGSITAIGDADYDEDWNLTGRHGFSCCENLTGITIPNGVVYISDDAFYYCYNLRSVKIPDGVISIGGSAFYECSNLRSVKIPDGVTSIGDEAFYYCYNLKSVIISDSVTSIGYNAFYFCYGLTSITVGKNNVTYKDIDGNLYTKDGKTLIQYAIGKTENDFSIPDGVISIGDSAFEESTLINVVIPDSVISIGNSAFKYGHLTSVEIPDSVTSIGESAFYECSSLRSVKIPDGVTSIGSFAFMGCSSLSSVDISDGATHIGIAMFEDCSNLSSITIPDSVTSIGERAFNRCSRLSSIRIPDGVTSIDDYVFCECVSLAHMFIHNRVTSIGESAFKGCASFTKVLYKGTEEQWASMSIANGNEPLTTATIHYNYVP